MSADRPVSRRRIAGETGPGREGTPSTPPAPTTRKPGAKKTPAKKAGAKKTSVAKVSPKRAPAAKASLKKPAKAVGDSQGVRDKLSEAPPASPLQPNEPATKASVDAKKTDEPATSGRLRVALLALAALVALTIGGVLMFKGIDQWRGGGDVSTAQAQAAEAASDAAETIFSFRYDKLPAHLKDSKEIMTPGFAEEFDKIAPALTDLAPQRKIVVQAVSRNSAAVDCGTTCATDKATILVFVDQARLVSGSDQPTVFGNRITMSMVKKSGTWLVGDIRAL